MARFLIVGAGPHATVLADVLEREGHVVSAVAHTARPALEHVAIVCWLEGSSPERFLLGSVDSSMRGFVYQAGGWERSVLETAGRNSIPVAALRSDPSDVAVWLAEARDAVASLIEGPGREQAGALC
ncbi:MAG TPA: hypothetical protein VNX67_10195 [Solirubrobacteraceae bacterium]|nr:hypothetical protein [Solirubrobacteraceae bacterium]